MRRPQSPLLAALAAALLGGALLASCQSSDEPPDLTDEQKLGYYFENALRYYNLRDLERAINQVQRGLEVDPDNERFLLMEAKIYQLRGKTADIARALEIYRKHPAQDDFRVQLGIGETNERLALIEDASADKIQSGELYTEAPDPEARAEELRRSAKKRLEEAFEAYLESNDLARGEVATVNGLVRVTALLRREHESIEWARQLIDVLGESSRLRRIELEDPNLTAGRERELLESVRANTNMVVEAHLHIANLYYMLGLKQEVVDELSRVVELDPARGEAYAQRAQVLYQLGRYQQASDSVQRFLELSTDLTYDHPNIQEAYALQRRCRQALAGGAAPRD